MILICERLRGPGERTCSLKYPVFSAYPCPLFRLSKAPEYELSALAGRQSIHPVIISALIVLTSHERTIESLNILGIGDIGICEFLREEEAVRRI